jgi:hypothetical protein
MGEVDVIKAIQLLPGVQSVSEGSSGFNVRGGGADQNLILLDEASVYNASHLMGFFSVFNNDAVKNATLYKGFIPPKYGGRLSSLLNIQMKEGNKKEISGSGGIGLISSRLTLEGPIVKDKTSFIASGRRTYADLFLPLATEEAVRDNTLYFYDFNGKLNHTINENNRIFISGYFGRDVFKNQFASMEFGNRTITARWNHLFSKKLFSNFSFINSRYDYHLGTTPGEANSLLWKSNLTDYSVKADFIYYINPYNTLKFGGQSIYHDFNPGVIKGTGEESLLDKIELDNQYAMENALYISNDQKLTQKIKLKYGLRYSMLNNIGKATIFDYKKTYNVDSSVNYEPIDSTNYGRGDFFNTYHGLEPRLAVNYTFNKKSSVKASYSRTRQYIHLAQNSTAGTPLDVWFPSNPNIKPQISDQYAIGYFRNFFDNYLETSVEVYYKEMRNSIAFKDYADLLLNDNLTSELRFGEATAYGVELMAELIEGPLTGWVSYTYSKTLMNVPDLSDDEFPAVYDIPHSVSVVMNYSLSKRISVSANWVYSTGRPVTLATGRAMYDGVVFPIYSGRNEYRFPDYHRADVAIIIKGKNKPNRLWHGEWVISAYNVYNRHNAWTINFEQDNNGQYYAEKTYLFPLIPTVTYNFEF